MGFKEALYTPFTEVDKRQGRGGYYDYIKWRHVVDRMNEVFDGRWSSEVISETVNEADIVIRVAVSITDSDNKIFKQEGYGGASVRGGEEPGTAHKSAYSKALKDACRKWGIGLYLDGDSNKNSSYNAPSATTTMAMGVKMSTGTKMPEPIVPITAPTPTQTTAPTQTTVPMQQPAPIEQETNKTATTMPAPPVSTPTESSPQSMPAPPVQGIPSSLGTGMPAPISMGADAGMAPPTAVLGNIPSSVEQINTPTQEPAVAGPSPDEPGTLTEVQKMAIKHMSKARGMETDEAVLTSIINVKESQLDRKVNSLEDLSYIEAVAVIKYIKVLNETE